MTSLNPSRLGWLSAAITAVFSVPLVGYRPGRVSTRPRPLSGSLMLSLRMRSERIKRDWEGGEGGWKRSKKVLKHSPLSYLESLPLSSPFPSSFLLQVTGGGGGEGEAPHFCLALMKKKYTDLFQFPPSKKSIYLLLR